jgi:hypothetical protein
MVPGHSDSSGFAFRFLIHHQSNQRSAHFGPFFSMREMSDRVEKKTASSPEIAMRLYEVRMTGAQLIESIDHRSIRLIR